MSTKNFHDDPKKSKWKKFAEDQPEVEQGSEADEAQEQLINKTDLELEYPGRQKLEEQLTAMEQMVDEYKDKNLRLLAQIKNTKEQSERDVANAHKYGTKKLLLELLPVMDSLVRGLESGGVDNPHAEGMKLTLDLLQKTLAKHSVEVIAPNRGDAFNPELHEAISMQPDPELPTNTVLTLVQQGYSLNGRVLRAAMVIVTG